MQGAKGSHMKTAVLGMRAGSTMVRREMKREEEEKEKGRLLSYDERLD